MGQDAPVGPQTPTGPKTDPGVCCSRREAFAKVAPVQAAMIAGLLGGFAAWSPQTPASMHTAMACPPARSEAHRPLLKAADEQVEGGRHDQAARSFVAAFDAMDLADRAGGTGRFAADRAVTAFEEAWRIGKDLTMLEEAETFLLHYLDVLDEGRSAGCSSVPDAAWADEKLAEVRGMMPEQTEPPPDDPKTPTVETPAPRPKDCPAAPAIIGVDRVGVALVTVGSALFISGTAFLIAGLVQGDLSRNPGQGFAIAGGSIMGGGVAFLIPGAVRLATWKRRQGNTRLGVAPFAGRGLAGVSVGGRFGARR